MNDLEMGLYSVNVGKMASILSNAYVTLIKNNVPLKKFQSVMHT